jgi:hypothetical protein
VVIPVAVLRSTDNGGSWQPVNNRLSTGGMVNALIATVNAYILPAATATAYFVQAITATAGSGE